MRFFLTGITGFIGSHLVRLLQSAGDPVSGTYLGGEPPAPEVETWEVDLRDAGALARAIGASDPDVIVHLGGLSHVGASWQQPAEYFQVNVLGTENVLRAAAGRKVVLASSAEVYGRVPEEEQPIPVARPVAPLTPYALTKAAAERLAIHHGAVVVRSFNAIGAGQAGTFALPAFARQVAAVRAGSQEPVLRVGNLEARRDFVHVEDVARGYREAALHGEEGKCYNLATGEATSIAEALDRLLAVCGQEVRIEPDPKRLRPLDVPLLCGDARELRALGWKPERSLEEALQELWQSQLEASTPRPGGWS